MTVPAGYALGRIQDFVEGAIHWNISIPYPVPYIGKKGNHQISSQSLNHPDHIKI